MSVVAADVAPAPRFAARAFADGTPWRALAGLAALLVVTVAAVAVDLAPRAALDVATLVAGHGALFVTALGWARASRRAMVAVLAALLAGAIVAKAHPLGALAYLAPAVLVARLAARGRLQGLGLGTPCPGAAFARGLGVGLCLALHMLVSAALTLGYRPRLDVAVYLTWLLYDAGVQVPATELFMRGALFDRAQRTTSLARATAAVTCATVLRYLLDPLLPRAWEVLLGNVLYMSLLSGASCWLFWRYGTPMPGVTAALIFFGAYRTIGSP